MDKMVFRGSIFLPRAANLRKKSHGLNARGITHGMVARLIHRDLARFDSLRLGQSQGEHALVYLRGDFAGVDGWIQLEHAPEVSPLTLQEERLTVDGFRLAVAEDG